MYSAPLLRQNCCSKRTKQTHITYACIPLHVSLVFVFLFFFGHLPTSTPLCFSSLISLIGLIPCSLACPIIFWNIQGNVSSCCHSNYYNMQHGLWHSSFWKCFSFFSRSSVTREGCGFFKGICSKLAQKTENAPVRGLWWGLDASWNDPPRICWIKSLHLDIIVLLLCWEFMLPEWDQISGLKMATCQRLAASPGIIFYQDKTLGFYCWLIATCFLSLDECTPLNFFWYQAAQHQTTQTIRSFSKCK